MSPLLCGVGFSHWSSALVSASSYRGGNSREFKYARASPAVRWPNWHEQQEQEKKKQPNSRDLRVTGYQASLAGLTTQLSVGRSRALLPINIRKTRCLRETGNEESTVSVSTEPERDVNDELAALQSSHRGEVDIAAHESVDEAEPSSSVGEDLVSDQAGALKKVAFWVGAAVTFGLLLGYKEGTAKASEFFAGYILEQSLSVDNLVVFVLIFNYFKVPVPYQNRVLTYGIIGAVVFRAIMIVLGVASIQRFEGLNLIFAAILVFSSFKLVTGEDDGEDDLSDNFIVNICKKFIPVSATYDGDKFTTIVDGVRKGTPLLLTLFVVELSDIAFAVDSIPAVFGVTKDPLIVYSSNIFAILGLRSLYTLIAGNLNELAYLQPSVGIVLGFIGAKMIAEFFGYHIMTEASLAVVAVVLGGGVGLSLLEQSKKSQKQ